MYLQNIVRLTIASSFDIMGSTLSTPSGLMPYSSLSDVDLSLLKDAEGNHCSSMPADLLQAIQRGAWLLCAAESSIESKQQEAFRLLEQVKAFDASSWAHGLQRRTPFQCDLAGRTHLAAAHRAATCIYLSRVTQSICPEVSLPQDLAALEVQVMTHLSNIALSDALFKATAWPTFILGAETFNAERQRWVTSRFETLWKVEPWGLIRGALGVLEALWSSRKAPEVAETRVRVGSGWIEELGSRGVNWLIL